MNENIIFDGAKWRHMYFVPGKKPLEVRWPTDAEWVAWASQRIIRLRGEATDFPADERVALELLQKIADGDVLAAGYDSADAAMIIDGLGSSFSVQVEPVEGGGYRGEVRLNNGGLCTAVMKLPNVREAKDAKRRFARRQTVGRVEHVFVEFAPQGELFDKLVESTSGYGAAGVPILHKAALVRAVLEDFESQYTVGYIGRPTIPAETSPTRPASGG